MEADEAPRVGDGVIVLDADRRIRFASPNAVSSLHRMGIHAYTQGLQLGEIGLRSGRRRSAACRLRLPVTEEIERGDTSMLIQAIPLLEGGDAIGAARAGARRHRPPPP